ncbi:LOW QUALITY PROTEIN: uncharacterized protein LOC129218320 [Uloborus diversus]|uniref:LOW QUALITY PROTEIN: uncharacterized protein LOC129218320 n=1 Tax=Uloborus diversus TaxID=327109 RepID=UPI00240A892C|nr:LOW QUALITY PROTEIN: uncharacterized protein LOC129218320 [Uloborus diversus]
MGQGCPDFKAQSCILKNCPVSRGTSMLDGLGPKMRANVLLVSFLTYAILTQVSVPHKRKILECEKEDFQERLQKIQRKLQLILMKILKMKTVMSLTKLKVYKWNGFTKKMILILIHGMIQMMYHLKNIKKCSSLLCKSKKWRDDRRRLLKISMAKIRGVEDPETYLRRSVLINNTVKRLQKDDTNNYRCHPSVSLFQTNAEYQSNSIDQWEVEHSNIEVMCKEHINEESASFELVSSVSNNDSTYNYPDVQQLSFASSCSLDKSMEGYQLEVLPSINSSFFNKNSVDEQRLNESSMPSRVLKPNSAVHVLSSQPCGLQYRNPAHNEDPTGEYHEANGSTSILDSVVYHSLIASLES